MGTPPGKRALRIEIVMSALVIFGLIAAAELTFRAMVPHLSANSRTLAAAPERAERILVANQLEEVPTVLVLGNSISGDGIAAELLSERLSDHGVTAHVEHQPADTTVVRDWYYELRNPFVAHGAAPDWLVLPVGDAAPLRRVNARTEDLMFSFVRWSDFSDFLHASGVRGLEDVAGTAFGKVSALYGFRGRFQKRILVSLADRYEALRYEMRTTGGAVSGEEQVHEDSTWAERLAAQAEAVGTQIVVVAMPTDALESTLPPEDAALAARLGWHVLAPGAGETWTATDRPDGLHLTPDARDRFTHLLAPELAQTIGAP